MSAESGEKHPRDERELSTALEVHTPDWLPGAKVSLTFRRLWDKKRERFVESAAKGVGVSVDELGSVIEDHESVFGVFVRAGTRASDLGDGMYSDVLARLVAAALLDEAKVDESTA